MAVTLPPHSNTSPGGDSSIQSSLLTPPVTPLDVHELPYRPPETDSISLKMKKRKHNHKDEQNTYERVCDHKSTILGLSCDHNATSHRIAYAPSFDPKRSKSVDMLKLATSGSVSPTSVQVEAELRKEEVRRTRRWTLPSKSAATRGLTPLRSTVKQSTWRVIGESPAMITLRRATTNQHPNRAEMTFFPEPTFSYERSGLLSYLVSTFTKRKTSQEPAMLNFRPVGSRPYHRSALISSNSAHPTLTLPAATVYTETTVGARLAMPSLVPEMVVPRRCSTKYTSGGITYEILWDNDDNSSATQEFSRMSASPRRPSVAMIELEAQLVRRDSSKGYSSNSSRKSSSAMSYNSAGVLPEPNTALDSLEQLFPRLLHKTGLRDLPRSRKSQQRRSTSCSITVNEVQQQTLVDDSGRRDSVSANGLFPPLRYSHQSRTPSNPPSRYKQSPEAFEQGDNAWEGQPQRVGSFVGSKIGSSSHCRRRSSAKGQLVSGITCIPSVDVLGDIEESESQPLLR